MFKNTIANIHVATTQPVDTNQKVCLEFTHFDVKQFFFVIVQVQVAKTTRCTTSNLLCSRQKVQTRTLTLLDVNCVVNIDIMTIFYFVGLW